MKLFQYLYSTSLFIIFWMCLMGSCASIARAALVKFSFKARLDQEPGPSFALPLGQRVSGSYIFELTTPAQRTNSSLNLFTIYSNALTNFTITIDGFGTGTGNGGDIFLGDPVRTVGSYNFLSDIYWVQAPVTGIIVPNSGVGIFGDRNLLSARIRLQDIDREALDSDNLLATPPDLTLFLDNTGPTYDTDATELLLDFGSSEGRNAIAFQLTELTIASSEPVPEPVSEPATIFGLATVLGCEALLKRKYSKKPNKN